VVVGGSLAGLLAARVLSDYFSEVSVIERDLLHEHTMQRPGVPHSRHLHALLPRGLHILEAFFPGIREELESYRAIPLDVGDDVAWLTPQGWGVKFRSGIEALSCTRDLLDWTIRNRIAELKNVRLVVSREVTGLLRGEEGYIYGVRTCPRSLAQGNCIEEVCGDLVVIATGRQNTIAKWFVDIGLQQPKVTTIDAHIGYASRMYRRPPQWSHAWKAIILQAAPPKVRRAGLMFPVEGDRLLVTLIGADRDYPPNHEAGFMEFARNLRNPSLYEAIRHAEPLTSIHAYRATENRQQHFERFDHWPHGLIAMGDAACAFNPVYGQGMSTAAIEAARLHSLLGENISSNNFGRTFQKEIARIIRSPWSLATSADLRFRSVEGANVNWNTRVKHWYVDRVLRAGTVDVWARRRFLEVQGMLREASAILKLDMLWHVLLNLAHIRSHPFTHDSVDLSSEFGDKSRIWNRSSLIGRAATARVTEIVSD